MNRSDHLIKSSGMNERGFTLIELLIVVSIIAILAAVSITSYVGVTKKATRSEGYGNLESLRLLQEQFYSENGVYAGDLGAVGDTSAIATSNAAAIRAVLPGFRPGMNSSFAYRIIGNSRLPTTGGEPAIPFNPGNVIPQNAAAVPPDPPCFVATATAIQGTRVVGDLFAVDCFNVRNF